jgi:hypothetical protein
VCSSDLGGTSILIVLRDAVQIQIYKVENISV